MIAKTRQDILTAMHSEAFGYARHTLFGRLARANGHPELAGLFEEIANAEYLEPFAEEARLVGLVGTDLENLEGIASERSTAGHRSAFRAALAKLRAEGRAPVPAGSPPSDADDAC